MKLKIKFNSYNLNPNLIYKRTGGITLLYICSTSTSNIYIEKEKKMTEVK